jgi:hypothetical protein
MATRAWPFSSTKSPGRAIALGPPMASCNEPISYPWAFRPAGWPHERSGIASTTDRIG